MFLRQRSQLLRQLRNFFNNKDFIEVQTPVLSADTVVDRYIEPLPAVLQPPTKPAAPQTLYFRTSPEFAMKRILAARGQADVLNDDEFNAIYEIGPVFRLGDRGQFHNPEFTMLEWYRIGDDYQTGMNLLEELIRFITKRIPIKRSFQEVFESATGLNPHLTTVSQCKKTAEQRGVVYPESFTETEDIEPWLDILFSELVQPKLKNVIVFDYPGEQPQLAQTRSENGYTVSERFELFLDGIEIANGYNELLDAEELQRRFADTNRQRLADGKGGLPVESKLLEAMRLGLPPCSGTALGVDRLLMVLTGAGAIDDVITFPIETA
ncbi:MAG: EF-P lysine aminoacylase GenX [Planctomycetaceae bacterium]|jgi:lysyl-tRNA synthetase class 2|nr:EF-P lysine aminoacylase GenX [Planctomycetaceae bacterium]